MTNKPRDDTSSDSNSGSILFFLKCSGSPSSSWRKIKWTQLDLAKSCSSGE